MLARAALCGSLAVNAWLHSLHSPIAKMEYQEDLLKEQQLLREVERTCSARVVVDVASTAKDPTFNSYDRRTIPRLVYLYPSSQKASHYRNELQEIQMRKSTKSFSHISKMVFLGHVSPTELLIRFSSVVIMSDEEYKNSDFWKKFETTKALSVTSNCK